MITSHENREYQAIKAQRMESEKTYGLKIYKRETSRARIQ